MINDEKRLRDLIERESKKAFDSGRSAGYVAAKSEPVSVIEMQPVLAIDTKAVEAGLGLLSDGVKDLSQVLNPADMVDAIKNIGGILEAKADFPPEFTQMVQVWVQALQDGVAAQRGAVDMAGSILSEMKAARAISERQAVASERIASAEEARNKAITFEFSDGTTGSIAGA